LKEEKTVYYTDEYIGCLLYTNIQKRTKKQVIIKLNPLIKRHIPIIKVQYYEMLPKKFFDFLYVL